MILTNYYKFERIATKAKTRLDCTASTKDYNPFEVLRCKRAMSPSDKKDGCNVGDLFVYYADVPEPFKADVKRKADKALTKTNNISSIYRPDITNNYAYGDIKGTTDAILFVLNGADCINGAVKQGAVIEVFIARGLAKDKLNLYNVLCAGELDEEMQILRDRAGSL